MNQVVDSLELSRSKGVDFVFDVIDVVFLAVFGLDLGVDNVVVVGDLLAESRDDAAVLLLHDSDLLVEQFSCSVLGDLHLSHFLIELPDVLIRYLQPLFNRCVFVFLYFELPIQSDDINIFILEILCQNEYLLIQSSNQLFMSHISRTHPTRLPIFPIQFTLKLLQRFL